MAGLPPLAKLRAARGLSQAELAKASGLDPATVLNVETGRTARPAAKTIGALARGLDMTIDDLLAALDVEEVAS